ncbi:Forkhead box protein O [Lasiodiplodia theobromae]|uniref:Forkhead box protein O n=2 Tax=Lasiodiplodia theobromae TaxID=45133 RepID=A0A5N5DRK1_9PEZI|nr:Forkhead box protein O [Lasiodiplodia theobromae]
MPSPALLVPCKQEDVQPQTLDSHEQLFEPPAGPSDLSFMDYDYPCQHPDFPNYDVGASSHPPPPLDYGQQYSYASPDYDPTCPRTFSSLGPDHFSDVCFPAGYQFPGQQQGFYFPGHGYQVPSPPVECPARSQSPAHMDAGFYPTPASHCLPFRDTHLRQEFGQVPHDDRGGLENEQDDKNDDKNEPYAKLIYRALMEKPGHTMVLRDIYAWFQHYTDKPKESNTKGWQNSIRHNLSMNGAFQKVEQPVGEDSKKANMWRLTDEAIREGVKSTTRYRKKEQQRRTARHAHNPHHRPSAQRQAAGAKGGDATKRSSEKRQVQQRQRPDQDLFEHGLGIIHPEDQPYPNPYAYYMQQQEEDSESRCTSLSPYQSFPQSPMQDQSWGCNTMSDVPSLFAPATAYFPAGSFGGARLGFTPSTTPSPSDPGDPPTPANNPGGLDVDPDGHLVPPAPTTFFEVEGALM